MILLLLYATVNPVVLAVEVFTKILSLSVTLGVVEAEIAELPNNVPELVPARLMELKEAVIVVPPVMFKPIKGLAALAAEVRRSPIRLLYAFIVVPALTETPLTVEDALLPAIS